jgi:hypothetical protein
VALAVRCVVGFVTMIDRLVDQAVVVGSVENVSVRLAPVPVNTGEARYAVLPDHDNVSPFGPSAASPTVMATGFTSTELP